MEEWIHAEYFAQDEEFLHRDPTEEQRFYLAIATGRVDYVRKNCEERRFLDATGVGSLSRDPVQNIKYHFVVGAALIIRICYEHGMELEKAYRLSDFYIQKLDDLHTVEDVNTLHDKMCMDLVRQMRVIRNRPAKSRPINDCLNYIYAHVKERITIEDLAEYTDNSTSYISRLFKEELGMSTSDYIRNVKLDAAKNMLRFSDYSLIDISNYLAFSSQSHFIQLFQKETGMTPKKFRETYYATQWKGNPQSDSITADLDAIDPPISKDM